MCTNILILILIKLNYALEATMNTLETITNVANITLPMEKVFAAIQNSQFGDMGMLSTLGEEMTSEECDSLVLCSETFKVTVSVLDTSDGMNLFGKNATRSPIVKMRMHMLPHTNQAVLCILQLNNK